MDSLMCCRMMILVNLGIVVVLAREVTVERLNDGLIVTRPDELAIEAGRWTILVRVADVQSPKAKKMEANIHGHAMRLYREIATEQEDVAERSKRVFRHTSSASDQC